MKKIVIPIVVVALFVTGSIGVAYYKDIYPSKQITSMIRSWVEDNILEAESYHFQLVIQNREDFECDVTVLQDEKIIRFENSEAALYLKINDDSVICLTDINGVVTQTVYDDADLVDATEAMLFPQDLDYIWNDSFYTILTGDFFDSDTQENRQGMQLVKDVDPSVVYTPFLLLYDFSSIADNEKMYIDFTVYEDDINASVPTKLDISLKIRPEILTKLIEVFNEENYFESLYVQNVFLHFAQDMHDVELFEIPTPTY